MVQHKDESLLLLKSIYGLAQSARQYFKKFISVLQEIGFEGGYSDPCLMVRQSKNGICFIANWVNDSLLVGDKQEIEDVITDLKKSGFSLKIEGNLEDYLSCEINFDEMKSKGWIH